jgi:hypothetical protein
MTCQASVDQDTYSTYRLHIWPPNDVQASCHDAGKIGPGLSELIWQSYKVLHARIKNTNLKRIQNTAMHRVNPVTTTPQAASASISTMFEVKLRRTVGTWHRPARIMGKGPRWIHTNVLVPHPTNPENDCNYCYGFRAYVLQPRHIPTYNSNAVANSGRAICMIRTVCIGVGGAGRSRCLGQ